MIERRTDNLQESLQLNLLILRTLRLNQIQSHTVLGLFGQVHVLHGSVGHIDLVLESAFLLRNIADKDGHLTKNDGVIQNKTDQHDENVYDFEVCPRAHFVATECQDGHVEDDHVLVPRVDLLHIVESVVVATLDVDKVERRYPLLLCFDNDIPDAANDVHNEQESQNEFENLDHGFLILLQFELLDDLRKASDTRDLEYFEQLEQLFLEDTPWERRNQIDKEHALDVTPGNLLPVLDLLALDREVRRAKLHENVDGEQEVDKVGDPLVDIIILNFADDKFETDAERGHNSKKEDKHVPN